MKEIEAYIESLEFSKSIGGKNCSIFDTLRFLKSLQAENEELKNLVNTYIESLDGSAKRVQFYHGEMKAKKIIITQMKNKTNEVLELVKETDDRHYTMNDAKEDIINILTKKK